MSEDDTFQIELRVEYRYFINMIIECFASYFVKWRAQSYNLISPKYNTRCGSRAAATSKMERFVIIVKNYHFCGRDDVKFKWDAFHDLVSFALFKKLESHPWRSAKFSKFCSTLSHGCFSYFFNEQAVPSRTKLQGVVTTSTM